jgi:hypothetical protein
MEYLMNLEGVTRKLMDDCCLKKTKQLFILEDIPEDKKEKAIKKYASSFSMDEEPLVLCEKKALGFFMCGFLLTTKNFYYFGVNDYNDTMKGSRNGVVPLQKFDSIEFKNGGLFSGYDHIVLNGQGPGDSEQVPKYFEIGDKEKECLIKFFSSFVPELVPLKEGLQADEAGNQAEESSYHHSPISQMTSSGTADNSAQGANEPTGGKPKKKSLHVLGIFRWPLVLLMSAGAAYFSMKISLNTKPVTVFFVGFVVSFILTTEAMLRILLGLAAAAGVWYVGPSLCESLLENQNQAQLVSGISAVVAFVAVVYLVSKSSWLGARCPSCSARGRITPEKEINRRYMGEGYDGGDIGQAMLDAVDHKNVKRHFRKYEVTCQKMCRDCGHSWTYTSDKKEYD